MQLIEGGDGEGGLLVLHKSQLRSRCLGVSLAPSKKHYQTSMLQTNQQLAAYSTWTGGIIQLWPQDTPRVWPIPYPTLPFNHSTLEGRVREPRELAQHVVLVIFKHKSSANVDMRRH